MADYFDMAPTPFNNLMNTLNGIASQVPTLANSALFTDSLCTTGRVAVNFGSANNWIARTCFAASCACGTVGAISSGTALASNVFGIPVAGAIAIPKTEETTLYCCSSGCTSTIRQQS